MEDLARKMAEQFHDIPIAVAVHGGRTYGAYIGNWEPYDLPAYDPAVAKLAIEMGLFNDSLPGEIDGSPVVWWRSTRA